MHLALQEMRNHTVVEIDDLSSGGFHRPTLDDDQMFVPMVSVKWHRTPGLNLQPRNNDFMCCRTRRIRSGKFSTHNLPVRKGDAWAQHKSGHRGQQNYVSSVSPIMPQASSRKAA